MIRLLAKPKPGHLFIILQLVAPTCLGPLINTPNSAFHLKSPPNGHGSCRNLIKKPWAFIKAPYMNPTVWVIGPGFHNQVPTLGRFTTSQFH